MGEAASKKYLPLENAERIAARVASELEPFCSRVAIAGSIRRLRETVGDIDLVAETSDPEPLARRLCAHTTVVSRGDQNISVVMQNGFGIQLFIARPAQHMLIGATEPGNWGTILLCRTGSREHNVWIAKRAQEKALHWNPYRGLMKPAGFAFVDYAGKDGRRTGHREVMGEIVAAETEEEIFAALDLEYIEPEDRER